VQRAARRDESRWTAAAAALRVSSVRSLAVRPAAGEAGNHRAAAGIGAESSDLPADVRAGRPVRASLVGLARFPIAHPDHSGGALQLRSGGVMVRGLRVGVIGCGYWGPNLVRNFARNAHTQVEAVCDLRYERAMRVGAEYRIPTITDRIDEVLKAPD